MNETSREPTRRRYLLAVGSVGVAAVAGCSGDGGTGNSTGGGGGGGGDVDIQGVERVTVAGGNITVRRAEESNVDGVRLYGPDNQQMKRGSYFNNVQREVNYSLRSTSVADTENYAGWPTGTYTLESVSQTGSQIDTDTIRLERSFEIVGASIGTRTGDGTFVSFEVRNTGDLPVGFDRIRVLESTDVEGYRVLSGDASDSDDVVQASDRPMGGNVVDSGDTGTVHGRGEFTYVNREMEQDRSIDSPSIPPCDDWEVQRTYELVGAADYATTVDVSVRVGGEATNVRGVAFDCGNVELLDYSETSGG